MKYKKKFQSIKLRLTLLLIICPVIVILLAGGCGEYKQGREKKPVIILGLDGFEWDFVLPMIKKKQLPNMVKLMKRGYYGELETFAPTFSPAIWTSIVTGKIHKKHGISNFFHYLPNKKITLVKSTDRKTKAIWNIVSDYKMSVWSIGWWITFPAEEINGIMVSQTNTLPELDTPRGRNEKIWKGTLVKGIKDQVYPPGRHVEMISLLREVDQELPALQKQIFGEFRYPLSPLGKRLWDNCRWSFRADTTYYRIVRKLVKEGSVPDLTLLYISGPDVVGHRFLRYMRPEFFRHKPTKEQISNFGTIIENYYAYCDRLLEQLMGIYGPDVTFFIISDHGMDPVNLEVEFNPDDPWNANISGGHKNKPPGFFLASGPLICNLSMEKSLQNMNRQDLQKVGTVFDITPTILTLMGIPIGKDMDGMVLTKIFRDEFRLDLLPPAVATHDTPGFLARQKKRKKKNIINPDEKERLEQLRSLGYIND